MPVKKTLSQFIEEANIKHNDMYDYSKTVYKKSHEKVIIICKEHGEFLVTPSHHIRSGTGCQKCSGCHKYTTEEFVEEAKKKHVNKYDYSRTVYKKANEKVIIICDDPGHDYYEFEIRAYSHLQGIGCKKCSGNYSPTTEEFIEEAKKKHDDKYDYSKTNYINGHEKIIIICPEHGEFQQSPACHLKSNGCHICSNEIYKNIRLTHDDFLTRATETHNKKYDYSKTVYIKGHAKVIIICLEHGEFEQDAKNHMEGQGCPECGIIQNSKNKCHTLTDFLTYATETHGNKYDYSKTVYKTSKEKVIIICKEHGEFQQTPQAHKNGQGCPECSVYNRIVDTEIFIRESKEKHGDTYDYSETIYTKNKEKLNIICPYHGIFEQEASSHKNGHGCPLCINKTETLVYTFIKQYESIILQFKANWCKNIRNLPFDLCIERLKIIIEIDGPQHFQTHTYFHQYTPYDVQHERDLFKQKCAIENGYSIIRMVQDEIFNNRFNWQKILMLQISNIHDCGVYYISHDDKYNTWE